MKAKIHPFTMFFTACLSILFMFPLVPTMQAAGYDSIHADLNCDGDVNIADAVFLMRFIAEDITLELPLQTSEYLDMNTDGLITILDVQFFLKNYFPKAVVTEPTETVQTAETTTQATTTVS